MPNNLAPIVLFAYNRPHHLTRVLKSLELNTLFRKSNLYIFIDGPKVSESNQNLLACEQVKEIALSYQNKYNAEVIIRKKNSGLAKSITNGVSKILRTSYKVIVLEDDILVSSNFLEFMNLALEKFQKVDYIGAVNAWSYPIKRLPRYYLRKGTSCWGWGTWRNRWELLNLNIEELKTALEEHSDILESLEKDDLQIWKSTIEGNCDSWWIRWHISLCLNHKLGVFPGESLIQNIGLDGSGTNCGKSPRKVTEKLSEKVWKEDFETVKISEMRRIENKIRLYKSSFSGNLMEKAIRRVKSHIL